MPLYLFHAKMSTGKEKSLRSKLTADNMADGIEYLRKLGYVQLLWMRESTWEEAGEEDEV